MFRVREDELLTGVNGFLAHEVFGSYRRSLFAAGKADQDKAALKERDDKIAAIRRAQRQPNEVDEPAPQPGGRRRGD
jgi:hypothetical protein